MAIVINVEGSRASARRRGALDVIVFDKALEIVFFVGGGIRSIHYLLQLFQLVVQKNLVGQSSIKVSHSLVLDCLDEHGDLARKMERMAKPNHGISSNPSVNDIDTPSPHTKYFNPHLMLNIYAFVSPFFIEFFKFIF